MEPVYPQSYEVRTVDSGGHLKYQGHSLFLSEVLRGRQLGLEVLTHNAVRAWYFDVCLGYLRKVGEAGKDAWRMEWLEMKKEKRA